MEVVRAIAEINKGRFAGNPAEFFTHNAFVLNSAIGWVGFFFIWDAIRCLNTPLFDVFISYKSEDSALARGLADALTANGWNVWFAEQQVLLVWRWLFLLAILRGIHDTRFGLALTNDRWASSPHCAREIRTLFWMLGPRGVREVALPRQPLPRQTYPKLAAVQTLESSDVAAILRFMKETTGAPYPADAPPPAPTSGARFQSSADGRPLSLLTEGWSLHHSGAKADAALGGQCWRYDALPEGQLFVNIHWGHELSREGQRVDQGIDDRRMFDALVKWAPKHIGRVRAKVRGVHVFFHSGLSQMGVTYWVRRQTVEGPTGPARVGGYWTRKISLIVPNLTTQSMAEFVFTFGFHGPYADYCRYAHIMDALALSLAWE
jgi:hypothetical protein